ncbi:MAG: HAMP domain-containing sensor histidine kinase [Bryobacteraceae bacterium]
MTDLELEANKLAALGSLIAGIIHEINTPVASILSNNEVVLRSLDLLEKAIAESQTERAQSIVAICRSLASVDKIACERIAGVVRSLKTFARCGEGDIQMVDIHSSIRNAVALTECACKRRIAIEMDFGDLPEMECYPQAISQVMLNLLVNATQAIEGEGKIVIRTRLDDDSIVISVADNGRGIREEDMSKVLVRGFTTKPEGVGTGLGLSIIKKIVTELHGGSIDFESQWGVGTTFHVRIPVRRSQVGKGA